MVVKPLHILLLFIYYSATATAKKPDSGEERVVGGKRVTGDERPPFMAIFNFKPSSTVKCTASIVSTKWLISAAHCMVQKKHFLTSPCLRGDTKIKFRAQCSPTKTGDIRIKFPEQEEKTPEVYVDVDDMKHLADGRGSKHRVDEIILPQKAYKGGQYGEYGGYDFLLIKVEGTMPGKLAACLPSASYQPSQPYIGGYGRYRRVPCETNALGPHVYEYCKVDPSCTKETSNFKQAKCGLQFKYKDEIHRSCIKDQPTPSQEDPLCKKLRRSTGLTDKEMVMLKLDEVVVLDKSNQVLTACYRTRPSIHGWCGTTKNTITGRQQDREKADHSIEANQGWGMCGDTCEDQEESQLTGKARVKKVEILDQRWCDDKLVAHRRGRELDGQDRGFWVFPHVYCVAYNETYRTKFFRKEKKGFNEVPASRQLFNKMGREDNFYIRATGSCKGDSGGPLYEKRGKRYTVIGTTSRGTGPIGNCGGRGNPTHYVRVKDMLQWMLQYIPESSLCVNS